MKKIAVVASAVLMSMGLGMAGAQQTSSVEQNKKGVVMKGFVQDIEDLASNRFEMSRSIPVHEDTANAQGGHKGYGLSCAKLLA